MKTETDKTTLPWTADELETLQTHLIASKRLLDAFPASLPEPCLLRRAPDQGADAVEAIPLSGEIVVGRKKGDPPLAFPADGSLSARHFRILMGLEGRCYAEDLRSTNGLWINGRRVRERLLIHGDQIHAGNQDFVFHAGPAPAWAEEEPQ